MYEGDGRFAALPRAKAACAEHYGQGEVVMLAPVEERSEASHRHAFAWLRDVWASLPEHIADQYPSAEHLRKKALIATGWCDVRDYACASRAEATRLAATLKAELDDYTVIILRDAVVRVARARSQAFRKMNKADFQASKTDVIRWVSDLIGADPQAVAKMAGHSITSTTRDGPEAKNLGPLVEGEEAA
jgi:hypothetical protein